MTREEFCKKLVESREQAMWGKDEMRWRTEFIFNQSQILENASNNFCIDSVLIYLKAINCGLFFQKYRKRDFHFDSRENFAKYFKKQREKAKLSQRWFAKRIESTKKTILDIESGKTNTAIDVLLACFDVLGLEVVIKPIQQINVNSMTRQDFCEKLVECRKNSQMKMKDICYAMQVMPTAVYRMESGINNFLIDNVLLYLKAINYGLFLRQHKVRDFHFDNRENFAKYFKKQREKAEMSQRVFAKKIEATKPTIENIESAKTNTAIDVLLSCFDALGLEVVIKPIQ